MKISEAIKTLKEIQGKYGDLEITGGYMSDDVPLRAIAVTETNGSEIWPRNVNNLDLSKVKIDGVFLES